MSVPTKYLQIYLKQKLNYKSLKTVYFNTTFPIVPNLFPNKMEQELTIMPRFSFRRYFKSIYYTAKAYINQFIFCRKFGLNFINPFSIMSDDSDACLHLVSLLPELQPRAHMFDANLFKFVGSTIAENIRNITQPVENQSLRKVMDMFECINPPQLIDNYYLQEKNSLETNRALVYASLGTVFNNDFELMNKIVISFKMLTDEQTSIQKQLFFIVSCGTKVDYNYNY
jgi:hypothetical protein